MNDDYHGFDGTCARDDDELMERASIGDEHAFESIVRRHGPRVLARARRGTRARDMAPEDVAQNAWLELYRYLPRYAPSGRFDGFLATLVRNQCRMDARRSRTREHIVSALEHETRALPPSAEDALFGAETSERVRMAAKKLSSAHREILERHFSEDMSLREIARELDIPVGTVKSRLSTALARMRELVSID